MISTVLAIGGSDPTGGAGIQADLKTLTGLGIHAAAAVTSITIQNSSGVSGIHPLAPVLVKQQVLAVLEDHQVSHIKIGMVGTPEIAGKLAATLADFDGIVIYDPVLAASTGQSLLAGDSREALVGLMEVCSVVTPNIPELTALTGKQYTDGTSLEAGARELLACFDLTAVVVTGGHGQSPGKVEDIMVLADDDGVQTLRRSHPRLDSPNTHGTGCTFASALAAFHCQGRTWPQAFASSADFVHHLIVAGDRLQIIRNPTGNGPLPHCHVLGV